MEIIGKIEVKRIRERTHRQHVVGFVLSFKSEKVFFELPLDELGLIAAFSVGQTVKVVFSVIGEKKGYRGTGAYYNRFIAVSVEVEKEKETFTRRGGGYGPPPQLKRAYNLRKK